MYMYSIANGESGESINVDMRVININYDDENLIIASELSQKR